MGGSMYLSRLTEFKNQKRQVMVESDDDDDNENTSKRVQKQPIKLNQYGIPDVVPSNLGDSFATNQPWKRQEEEVIDKKEGMMGLLNQFYDLSNNPTI